MTTSGILQDHTLNKNFPGVRYMPAPYLFFSALQEEGNLNKSLESSTPPIRILLADDDIDDRELFQEAIGDSGFNVNVELAEDGCHLFDLLKLHERKLPNLIFLDLNMPNKNGKECLEEIRKNEIYDNIPVIIYSTSSATKDIDETFEKGANLYVRKPSSFNELLDVTKKVLMLNWENYKPNSSRNNYVFPLK